MGGLLRPDTVAFLAPLYKLFGYLVFSRPSITVAQIFSAVQGPVSECKLQVVNDGHIFSVLQK